jgi:hypothetical protein
MFFSEVSETTIEFKRGAMNANNFLQLPACQLSAHLHKTNLMCPRRLHCSLKRVDQGAELILTPLSLSFPMCHAGDITNPYLHSSSPTLLHIIYYNSHSRLFWRVPFMKRYLPGLLPAVETEPSLAS